MSSSREQSVKVTLPDNQAVFDLLPGSPYEQVLMPLDYPPSRDYTQRWGYSKPLNKKLVDILAANSAYYLEVVDGMKVLEPNFRAIPAKFDGLHAGWLGGAMNALDLALLYYFVVQAKPKTIVEIGSGISTHFARKAISDFNLPTHLLSIDPQPRAEIDRLCDEILRDGLETMSSFEVFASLEPGDVVFLDGSHRSFMNSDVTVFFIDILPVLKPGVLIQIHDIHLPYDYPPMFRNWYWNEQYMLAVHLLAGPEKVHILFPAAYVSYDENLQSRIKDKVPSVESVDPTGFLSGGSFWFTPKLCGG